MSERCSCGAVGRNGKHEKGCAWEPKADVRAQPCPGILGYGGTPERVVQGGDPNLSIAPENTHCQCQAIALRLAEENAELREQLHDVRNALWAATRGEIGRRK